MCTGKHSNVWARCSWLRKKKNGRVRINREGEREKQSDKKAHIKRVHCNLCPLAINKCSYHISVNCEHCIYIDRRSQIERHRHTKSEAKRRICLTRVHLKRISCARVSLNSQINQTHTVDILKVRNWLKTWTFQKWDRDSPFGLAEKSKSNVQILSGKREKLQIG